MDDVGFLRRLLEAPGPSSFETRPATVWSQRARDMGLEVRSDSYGNVFATANPGGRPRVMLSGHIDEIGLLITYVDGDGMLYFQPVGGWEAQQLVGQRVRLLGHGGDRIGLIGRKPVHLMNREERDKPVAFDHLWIDLGTRNREEALALARPGDVAVIEQPLIELSNGRLAARALDNRIGAFAVLEAARRSQGARAEVVAVATVQEEIGGLGASAATFSLEPAVAIAVDVTHATDVPGIDKKRTGERPLGSGPELAVGSYIHRGVLTSLSAAAEAEGIPYTVAAYPRVTSTEADLMAGVRSGVPTAVVSIPLRYMHSANEMVDPADVEHVIRLLETFARNLPPDAAFRQPER